MPKRFSSVKSKIFAVISVLTVALVGFFTTYFPARQIAFVHARMESKAATYARLVSEQVASGVAFDDRETVREVFAATATDGEVQALALYRADGSLLYGTGEVPVELALPPVKAIRVDAFSTYLRSVAPVVAKEGPSGTLVLELSTKSVDRECAEIRRAAALLGLLALLAGLLAAWALGGSLSRRLRTLAAATQAVAGGDLSRRPIEDTSNDELGQLTRSFATMHASIGALVEHIREASEQERGRLDVLVRERTAELEASLDRYKALVESTNAVPWELDPESLTFSYVSPQATRLFGLEPKAMTNTETVWDLFHPDDREKLKAELSALGRATEARDVDLEHRTLNTAGQTLHVRSSVSATGITTRDRVLRGISFDVTQQKKLELELRQAQKLESVGRLAAGVAHEINTPVQFVGDSVHFVRDAMQDLGELIASYRMLHLAAGRGGDVSREAEQVTVAEEKADLEYLLENVPLALERSIDGLGRISVIVRSMKEFAHPDEKEMTAVDLNRAIESTLTIARSEYKYVADVETDFGELPPVVCHGGDMNQAFLNILVNAAHAIGDVITGTEKKGLISVRTRLDGAFVTVTISDTGGGIPESVRERIFDPFFTTKGVGRGTGQGLAIARSVIREKHGGELTFETELGRGTSFSIRLPVDGVRKSSGVLAA